MRRSAVLLTAVTGLSLAGVADSTTAVARLSVNPSLLGYGSTVTIKGTGFAPRINVTINVRRPNGLPTAHWTTLRANRSGGFRYVRVVARSAVTGRYVAVACQRACRIKATAAFRIVKVQPL